MILNPCISILQIFSAILCCLVTLLVFFAPKFLILMKSNLSFFSFCLLWFKNIAMKTFSSPGHGYLPPMLSSKSLIVLAMYLCFWFILSSFLYKVWSKGLTSFFRMWISSSLNTVCWKGCIAPNDWSWHPCWLSVGCTCEGFFLNSHVYSLGFWIYSYANTTLFWFL